MNFYPYQNMYGVPATNMPPAVNQRPMFPEPQYMQQPVQSGMIWVKNRNEADNFPVPANTAVALWDSSGPFVHRKEADVSGKPVVKTFKLVEVTDYPQQSGEKRYVTYEEFQSFINSLNPVNYQPKFAPKEESVNE